MDSRSRYSRRFGQNGGSVKDRIRATENQKLPREVITTPASKDSVKKYDARAFSKAAGIRSRIQKFSDTTNEGSKSVTPTTSPKITRASTKSKAFDKPQTEQESTPAVIITKPHQTTESLSSSVKESLSKQDKMLSSEVKISSPEDIPVEINHVESSTTSIPQSSFISMFTSPPSVDHDDGEASSSVSSSVSSSTQSLSDEQEDDDVTEESSNSQQVSF